MSLAFWENIIKDFDLKGGYAEEIPKPEKAEVVHKDLVAGLKVAHVTNPAARTAAKLTRYLEYAKPPNETELRGLLLGSSESPSCSKTMAATLSEAVLQYLGRCMAHTEHPKTWSQVSVDFDSMLVGIWQRCQARGLSRSQFMRTWRAPLAMFMPMELAVEVNENAADENSDGLVQSSVEKLVRSSLIAAELFAP